MGLQFHETVRGKNFFEYQLPKLTRAIEELAGAMKAPAPTVVQPQDMGNRLLTDECREALIAIMNCPKKAEAFGDEIAEQVRTDDEQPRKVGFYAAKAILDGSINDLLIAICGFSVASLVEQSAARCEDCEEDE